MIEIDPILITVFISIAILLFVVTIISLLLENLRKKDSFTLKMKIGHVMDMIIILITIAVAKSIFPDQMNLSLLIICAIGLSMSTYFQKKIKIKRNNS